MIAQMHARGHCPSSSAVPACTCVARWIAWNSPVSRRRSGPGCPTSCERRCAGDAPAAGRVDPAAAAAILPSNGRRIVRALEVIELTGGPFTARMPGFESIYPVVHVGLDRADLDDRVKRRVHADDGRRFPGRGAGAVAARPARQSDRRQGARLRPVTGRASTMAAASSATRNAAVEATVRATRRFVRRQRSWFRRDPRIGWLDAAAARRVRSRTSALPRRRLPWRSCGW